MSTGNNNEVKFYTIGEVSEITQVKQTVLRFWETEFSNLQPRKNKFGHRAYTSDDIAVVEKIKELLYKQGLTIKGAKNYFVEKKTDKNNGNDFSAKTVKKNLLEMLDILKGKK